jgi:hypothetical protein
MILLFTFLLILFTSNYGEVLLVGSVWVLRGTSSGSQTFLNEADYEVGSNATLDNRFLRISPVLPDTQVHGNIEIALNHH